MNPIPLSRFLRELNKLTRWVNNNPDKVLYISRNKKIILVFSSVTHYNDLVKLIEE